MCLRLVKAPAGLTDKGSLLQEPIVQGEQEFSVRRVTPEENHRSVRQDSVVRILFSEKIAKSEEDLKELIKIEPAVEIAHSAVNGHIALLVPRRLDYGTTYTVTVSDMFRSKSGRHLSASYRWQFTIVTGKEAEAVYLTANSEAYGQAMRVQGGACRNASKDLFGSDGKLSMRKGRLYFTVASLPIDEKPSLRRWNGLVRSAGFFRRRQSGWLDQSCEDPNSKHPQRNEPYVVCFKVKRGFLHYLRQTSIPEHLTRFYPERPQLVDISGGDDQYGLPLNSGYNYLYGAKVKDSVSCHPKVSKGCNGLANEREPQDLPSTDDARIAEFLSGACYEGLDPGVDTELVRRADEKR